MRPRLHAIDVRVLTIILLVALPVLAIGAAVVISIGQSRLHETQSTRLAQIAEYTAGAVDAYVFRRILDGALLGRVPDVRRAAAAGSAQPYDEARAKDLDARWTATPGGAPAASGVLANPVSAFLADLVSHDSVYREILVTDRHGRLVSASNVTSDYFQADEDWWIRSFDRGRGRVSVTDVRRDESTQVYAFEIAVPVHAPGSDELVGIMKIVADSRELLAGIAGLEMGASGEALLVRPDGSIVFSRRPHREGDRFFAAELLQQRLDQRAVRRESTGPLTFEAQTDEADRRLVAIAPSQLSQSYPELTWLVALSMDREELGAPFRSLVWYLALVFALTAVAVLAIALWLSLRLAAPVTDPAFAMHLVEHPPLRGMQETEPRPYVAVRSGFAPGRKAEAPDPPTAHRDGWLPASAGRRASEQPPMPSIAMARHLERLEREQPCAPNGSLQVRPFRESRLQIRVRVYVEARAPPDHEPFRRDAQLQLQSQQAVHVRRDQPAEAGAQRLELLAETRGGEML